jgi:hypothetical protein
MDGNAQRRLLSFDSHEEITLEQDLSEHAAGI